MASELNNYWGIKVTGVKEWISFFNAMSSEIGVLTSTTGPEIAQKVISMMNKRLDSGKDIEGNTFADYSTAYQKKKKSSIVNMKFTGSMRNSLKYSVKFDRSRGVGIITIYVDGKKNSVKAYVHQTGGPSGRRGKRFMQKERKWFGITENEKEQIMLIPVNKLKSFLDRYISAW